MEESEQRISDLASAGNSAQAQVARRILEEPRLYVRWESEHQRLMRTVASEAAGIAQARALRNACFGLIHRKAMFEYLRQQKITGRDRHEVFALVYGEGHDYAAAVIHEHGNYVRSTSSYLASNHLGLQVIEDRAFGEPFWRYELLYNDYFRTFCGTALKGDEFKAGETLRTLLPYLKRQLSNLRRVILALPHEPDDGLHTLDFKADAANTARMYKPFEAAS